MRAAALFLAFACFALPASAADAFDDLVHQVESAWHVKPVHVPLVNGAALAGSVATPFAMRSMKIAVFEDLPEVRKPLKLTPPSGGWQRAIYSVSDGERVSIYALASSARIRLLVVTAEEDELVVIESEVTPAEFARQIEKETSGGEDGN